MPRPSYRPGAGATTRRGRLGTTQPGARLWTRAGRRRGGPWPGGDQGPRGPALGEGAGPASGWGVPLGYRGGRRSLFSSLGREDASTLVPLGPRVARPLPMSQPLRCGSPRRRPRRHAGAVTGRGSARPRRGPPCRRPSGAFFDLDKTIIAKSSTLAFSKPFQAGGLISRRAVLRSAYAQFVYLVGGADHDQMEKMRQFLSALCAGWDVQTVRDIVAETLHNVVDPLVYDEAVSLIEEHHLAGRDVIIVSASGTEVVEPIGRAARRRRCRRDPDGDRRRPLHRRDRLLRLRREQGRGAAPAGRASTTTTSRAATPTATRSPTCTCSRRSATRTR